MLIGSTVLVESRLGSDHVGVRRDTEGEAWLASWSNREPDRVTGCGLQGLEPESVYGDGWLGVGGLLPARGVRRVEARAPDGTWHPADVGDDAWSLIVACAPWTDDLVLQTEMAGVQVRLFDDRGALVSRVTPEVAAASRRVGLGQRLLQTRFPNGLPIRCPVCRHGRWRVVGPLGSERIFCGRCGHGHPPGWVS